MERLVAARLAVLALTGSAVADDSVRPHARVRVATRTDGRFVGTLLRTDSSSLTPSLNGSARTFALDDVTGFEVSRARRSQRANWASMAVR